MIDASVQSRIATVILGASRCRGFALVMFYDGGDTETLVAEADPMTAGELLKTIAGQFYRGYAGNNVTVTPAP